MVATVGGDMPHLRGIVPDGGGNGRLEDGKLVQVVFAGDRLAVSEDLGTPGVMIPGHVVELVEQRQVVISHNVASNTRVAIPVPGAAHVRSALDYTDAFDAALAQARRG